MDGRGFSSIAPRRWVSILAVALAVALVSYLVSRSHHPRRSRDRVGDLGAGRAAATADHMLAVLTYNTFLRSPPWLLWDEQDERVEGMPAQLAGYDVVVLQEVFSNRHRHRLVGLLAAQYPYRTSVVGSEHAFREDGGVMILSRWPIVGERQIVFADCAGVDCMADKGAVYARIAKKGRTYHIIGAHTQDGLEHRAERESQFREIAGLIVNEAIPASEPVIIAGDLNVDLIADREGYVAMLRILDAAHPPAPPGAARTPTWDSERNPLVSESAREYLDYVLLSKAHAQPSEALVEVLPLRSGDRDLSDHYAVVGRMIFPRL